MGTSETVVFGHKQGEPEYTEILLVTQWDRVKDKAAALAMMERDGWVCRVAVIDLTTPPDFRKAIRR